MNRKNALLALLTLALVAGLSIDQLARPPAVARTTATLELYGTFHAMGVIVTLDAADDPDGDAVATVEYRSGGDAYRAGLPLARVDETHFVGSLFWLTPGTPYDVRVAFQDPDGALDGVTLDASGATRAEITLPEASHTYTVSPDGSGTACTQSVPCALDEGLSQVQAGEAVVLRGGTYYQGDLSLWRAGAAGAPIVIRGEAGETAILDGADPTDLSWSAEGDGVYRAAVNVADPHLVMAGDQRLFPYDDLGDLGTLSRDGTPGFYVADTTLYVHLAGDADPNTADMIVSRYGNAFTVEADYVYLVDLTFRHYGQGAYPKVIYINDASDNLVQGCTFAYNDVGIGLKRDAHRNVIQDNTFYDAIFDWPWEDIKALGGLEDGGVVFYAYPFTGRGNVIRRNVFHDDFDGLSACPEESEALTDETDVYENQVYRVGDDGMETDGRCSNVRIWDNTFHDVLMGISLAPVYDGPVYAVRNLIYRTGVGNNDYSGSPFKFNSGYGRSGPMYLLHNTADAALPGNNGLYIKAPGTWDLIYSRNNVWAGTAYALDNYNTDQPLDMDYDDLWHGGSGDLVRWDSQRYATLGAFTAATGHEAHGLSVAPGFVDAAAGDYTLSATSALIDAGVVLPGINDDYAGAAPDVGAFERAVAADFTLTAQPAAQTIAPGGVATYALALSPLGGFSQAVVLQAASPSPSLTLHLAPSSLTPPGQATLTVTDAHSTATPALWYTIPVTATGGGVTHTVQVMLLVGGRRVYLPLTLKP